jgi:hypothetical protein
MTPSQIAALGLALLAAASCRPAPETAALDNEGVSGAETGLPEADINESLALDLLAGADNHMAAPEGYGGLPPDNRVLRFVGRWATDVGQCRGQPWTFTPDGLTAPTGTACRFEDIASVEDGFDIAARCTADGEPRADELHLRFAESAHTMLVESRTLEETGLVYCGPVTAP